MSLKKLLGLPAEGISECEIYSKIAEAMRNNIEEVDITDPEGNLIRIHIPSLHFDPVLMNGIDSW